MTAQSGHVRSATDDDWPELPDIHYPLPKKPPPPGVWDRQVSPPHTRSVQAAISVMTLRSLFRGLAVKQSVHK